MRILIQRSKDGFFLRADGNWAASKWEAMDFKSCTPAIDYCVEQGLKEVRLWMSFDDQKYDFPLEIFRAETRVLVRQNKELRAKRGALLAAVDQERAKAKERKKLFPFIRKRVRDEQGSSA